MKKESWWGKRLKEFIHLVKAGFPYIVLTLGVVMLILGMAKSFDVPLVNSIVERLGELFLGAGLFTFMIKSFQYTNVFRDELTKVIFEPQYLANRKDLSEYWGRVSRVVFEDKFKKISRQLLNDISSKYFPTNSIMYYDDAEHTIEIILNDPITGDATLKRNFKLRAIPEDPRAKHKYSFGIAIPLKTNVNDIKFSTTVKVNGNVKIAVEAGEIPNFLKKDGSFVKQYEVELKGSADYLIERIEEVKYNLYFDNILYFQGNKIHNKLKVNLHYPKNLLNIELKKCGTLEPYTKDQETTSSARYVCNGLIYPEQGYYINIRKAN